MGVTRLPVRSRAPRERRGTSVPAAVLVAGNAVLAGLLLAGLWAVALFLAVVVPIALALARRPQRGLLLLAALIPFNGLLLVLPHPGWANGWKEGLALATLAATFVAPPSARGRPGRRLPGWVVGAAAFLALGVFSAGVVGGLRAAQGVKIGYFFMLVGVVAWRCPLDTHERDRLVTILMSTGALVAVVGLGQQVLGAERLADLGYEYNSTIRTTGGFLRSFSTFNQPFGFAYYLMVVVLVCMPVALSDPRRFRNRLFLLSLPLLGLGLLSSFVRGALLGLGIGTAWLGSQRYKALLLVVPAGMVALLFVPSDLTATTLSSSSSEQRATGWQDNLPRILRSPAGIGIGATGSVAEKVATLTREESNQYQPDNYYVKVTLELGVIGLWLLVLVLAATFAVSRAASVRLAGRDAALASGVSAMVLGAAASSLVATYFEIFPMDLLFWLLVTVVATCDPASD